MRATRYLIFLACASIWLASGCDSPKPDLKEATPQSPGASPNVVETLSPFLNLDAVQISVAMVEVIQNFHPQSFHYVYRYVEPGTEVKMPSPDGKRLLWRGQDKDGYFLFTSDSDGKNIQTHRACRNAYQPSWAPDSRRVVFSSIDWKTRKRRLMLYDLENGKLFEAFASPKGIGSLAAFSPNGSKIAFTYFGELWIMNSNGIGRSKLYLKDQIKAPIKEAALFAWAKDSSRLAYQPLGHKEIFLLHFAYKNYPITSKSQ